MDSLSDQPFGELPGPSVPLAPVAGGLLELEPLEDELLLGTLEDEGAGAGGEEATLPLLLATGAGGPESLLDSGEETGAEGALLSPPPADGALLPPPTEVLVGV